MISELHIENIAVIKKLTVDFKNGFSVLTGETGAGKSIIIDSVNLLLGARSARELVRTGERTALVSACFTDIPESAVKELAELDIFPDEEGSVYIQRTLTSEGKTQAKINGRSVPGAVLRDCGRALINIHGQHDSVQLLMQEKHMGFLDAHAHTEELISEYSACYEEMLRLRREIRALNKSEQESEYLNKTLTAQISEIEGAKLKSGEEDALNVKLERIKNIEKIARYSTQIVNSLSYGTEGRPGALEQIRTAIEAVERLASVLPESAEIIERLNFCALEVQDIAESAEALTDGEMSDPEELIDRLQSRLDLISSLEKKYGTTVDEVLAYKVDAEKRLSELKNSDKRIKELKAELASEVKKAGAAAQRLTEKRLEGAKILSEEITAQLHYLDLEKASFKVSVTPLLSEDGMKRFSPQGCDYVEFLISTNPGEPCKPLGKVASGGELSRVMLALKTVLADSDGVGTIIFDEIDTGVSGKTSQKIGIRLLELAKHAQVFSITHSAQIAAMGDVHYRISKHEIDGRNETEVNELSESERVDEIARIMGGIEITDTLKKTAKEMIKAAESYR